MKHWYGGELWHWNLQATSSWVMLIRTGLHHKAVDSWLKAWIWACHRIFLIYPELAEVVIVFFFLASIVFCKQMGDNRCMESVSG